MILLAMALLADDYGAFNVAHTREICRVKIEGAYREAYDSIEACIDDHRADYRRFNLLAERSSKVLEPAFRDCVRQWTKDGMIDWGMAGSCAVDVVDGKRDYDMFLEAAPNAGARAAIRRCRTYWTDEDTGVVDWMMAGGCAANGGKAPEPVQESDPDEIVVT